MVHDWESAWWISAIHSLGVVTGRDTKQPPSSTQTFWMVFQLSHLFLTTPNYIPWIVDFKPKVHLFWKIEHPLSLILPWATGRCCQCVFPYCQLRFTCSTGVMWIDSAEQQQHKTCPFARCQQCQVPTMQLCHFPQIATPSPLKAIEPGPITVLHNQKQETPHGAGFFPRSAGKSVRMQRAPGRCSQAAEGDHSRACGSTCEMQSRDSAVSL